MRLYISGQKEKDILLVAISDYFIATQNPIALKLLKRVVDCIKLQDKKEKAVTPKNESND